MDMIGWKMNGTEYVGRLGSKEIVALEKTLGVGIYKVSEKLGVEFTKTALQLAAMRGNRQLDSAKFENDFDAELDAQGLGAMSTVAMNLVTNSGALGKEAKEKKE